MANAKVSFLVLILSSIFSFSWQLKSTVVDSELSNNHVIQMNHKDIASDSARIQKRSVPNVQRSKRDADDQLCQTQETNFINKLDSVKNEFSHVHFFNETKSSMALIWIEQKVVVVVTEEELDYQMEIHPSPSSLYRSDDEGKVFEDITKNIDSGHDVKIKKKNGLQKNGNQMFLVLHGDNYGQTTLMSSTDAGTTYERSTMPFPFNGALSFNEKRPNYILAYDDTNMALYLSTDTGRSWKMIKEKVQSFRWSTYEHDPADTIYISSDPDMEKQFFYFFPSGHSILEKSVDAGNSWTTVHDNIVSFGLQGKFIYTSVKAEEEGHRYMEVSTDGGSTWDEVQLPTITQERFYSILDMSEGQVFMHVDDPGDTGVGTIYTSDGSGVIFSESLQNHLFPNFEDVTDFYKVNSMRGVYIGSQLDDDASVHSVITFSRGAEWGRIKRPDGTACVDEHQVCYLQIHNRYSAERGVKAPPPKSMESAVGIILAHGHVASALQVSEPDVYVSDDGGYSWRLSLDGPHYYEIADQGGLLVAIPDEDHPKHIKFSTDEGNCWHKYQFTSDDITFTGLLTEPGNKAMSVAIWAYGVDDKQWRVYVIDFETIINNKCTDNDYQVWKAHSDNTNDGCFLGKKDTFQRLKQDSWCLNGHSRELSGTKTSETCPCTKDDYDCDYGYMREVGSDLCVSDPEFKGKTFDICKRGNLEELKYAGYHKIPGDQCDGGFKPASDYKIDLKEKCKEGDKSIIEEEEGIHGSSPLESTNRGRAVLVVTVLSVFIVLLVLVIFLVRKYRHLRQSKLVYRYSMINEEAPEELEQALGTNTSLYEDSSDEEDPQVRVHDQLATRKPAVNTNKPRAANQPMGPSSQSPRVPNGVPARSSPSKQPPRPEVRSYHDDSDEDMLE